LGNDENDEDVWRPEDGRLAPAGKSSPRTAIWGGKQAIAWDVDIGDFRE
jgi:hypothetical protein